MSLMIRSTPPVLRGNPVYVFLATLMRPLVTPVRSRDIAQTINTLLTNGSTPILRTLSSEQFDPFVLAYAFSFGCKIVRCSQRYQLVLLNE